MPNRRRPRAAVALADGAVSDDARRLLLAEWCRLVGQRLSDDPAVESDACDGRPAGGRSATGVAGPAAAVDLDLPPRVGQTLDRLLAGRSEKQIALDLGVSPHTVHAYVKQLHKRLNVNSRGELLSLFVARRSDPVAQASVGRTHSSNT